MATKKEMEKIKEIRDKSLPRVNELLKSETKPEKLETLNYLKTEIEKK